MNKDLNASLSDIDRLEIEACLERAQELMPFLTNLTPDDRMQILKLGERSKTFADKFAVYLKRHPEILPGYIPADRLQEEYKLWSDLYALNQMTAELAEAVNDTLMLVGSSLFDKLLTAYNNVGNARRHNLPGVDSMHADLQKRFLSGAPISIDEEGLNITDNEVEENADTNSDSGIGSDVDPSEPNTGS